MFKDKNVIFKGEKMRLKGDGDKECLKEICEGFIYLKLKKIQAWKKF